MMEWWLLGAITLYGVGLVCLAVGWQALGRPLRWVLGSIGVVLILTNALRGLAGPGR